MPNTVKIRWATCPTDPSKVGKEESVDPELANELVWFGNAVIVGSQQDKDIQAAKALNKDQPTDNKAMKTSAVAEVPSSDAE